MPRPATIAIYSVVFGMALLAGILVAAVLLPQSLPAVGLATPTVTIEPLASVADLVGAAPAAMPDRPTATPVPSATRAPATPTSTAQPSPTATELTFPTITPPTMATPTPTTPQPARPLAFVARIVEQPTDAAVPCGTSFESQVWGTVKDRAGHGVYQAVAEVRSADGQHHFRTQTNDQGGFELPGLGCTTWIVQLISVPHAPAGVQASELHINLNGGRYSGAGVEFQQR